MSRRFLRNLNHVEIEANFLVKQVLKMGSKHYTNNHALIRSERAAKTENEQLRKQQSVHQNMIQQQDEAIRARDAKISFLEQQLQEKEAVLVKFRKMCDRSAPSSNGSIGSDGRAYGNQSSDRRMGPSSQGILHPSMLSNEGLLHSGRGILHSNKGIMALSGTSVSGPGGYSTTVQASFGHDGYGDNRSHASHHISKKRLVHRRSAPQGGYYSR
jgi:hypothetical protein